jgi:hypothetical protein
MRNICLTSLTFVLLCTVLSADKKYPMTTASIVPGARAELSIGTDRNGNTSLKITVEHLANPELLTPHAAVYVIWLRERGGATENLGQLKVDKNLSTQFETVTSLKAFDIFVTAEQDVRPASPTGSEVLRATVQP